MKRVMVIDALNMFIRNYIVNPMISSNGNPIGGAVGFLNSVKKLMREAKPDQVIICWDGAGGSQKRRQTVKEYKQGRKPLRKNYKVEGMSVQSEKENMVWSKEESIRNLARKSPLKLSKRKSFLSKILNF